MRFGMDLELHFGDFCLPKRVQKSGRKKNAEKMRKTDLKSLFGPGPAERAEPGERYREGLRRAKIEKYWEKILEGIFERQNLSNPWIFEFSTLVLT